MDNKHVLPAARLATWLTVELSLRLGTMGGGTLNLKLSFKVDGTNRQASTMGGKTGGG